MSGHVTHEHVASRVRFAVHGRVALHDRFSEVHRRLSARGAEVRSTRGARLPRRRFAIVDRAALDPRANCDSSTTVPVLNVSDFTCFQPAYSAGCP
jgi:hypothetical protein